MAGPVAQLDRALRFERRGWEFKSLRVHHYMIDTTLSLRTASNVATDAELGREGFLAIKQELTIFMLYFLPNVVDLSGSRIAI
ncbi:MAG: hypothetical protein QOD84_1895 [Acidobacteriaceae bacterium]|jgi:hypothetical protein